MISMKDIAKRCGVSVATVSKALNGHTDISDETKRMVREMCREMGYLPNSSARALKTKRTYNLGVLFIDEAQNGLTHDYFARVLDAFKVEAESKGYDITFINSSRTNRTMTYLEHSCYRGVDGVVIASADFTEPKVQELINYTVLPVVTIDHMFNGHVSVMSDNITGMNDLTRYVLKRGHRKLALIHGEKTTVTMGRLAGFHRACEEYGVSVNEKMIFEGIYHDPETCYEITKKILSMKNRPSCIFFPDDYSYLGGMKAIAEAGLKVPEDISAVGYDGIPISRVLSPVLTTWRQSTTEMGKTAAARLIEQIDHPKTSILDRVIISGTLQEGASVADIS